MRATLKPLADQTIVVTGASSGIGLVTARMAAKSGAAVVAAARNEAALRNLVHEIREGGGRAAYAVCDVGSEEDIAWVVAAADREMMQASDRVHGGRGLETGMDHAVGALFVIADAVLVPVGRFHQLGEGLRSVRPREDGVGHGTGDDNRVSSPRHLPDVGMRARSSRSRSQRGRPQRVSAPVYCQSLGGTTG